MLSKAAPRVAVVGAGAAGLTAVKELRAVGAEVVAYDKGDRPGGLWVNKSASGISPAYDSLHLNTSKGRTEFADFPMPKEWPDYPSVDHVAGYLADYADEFGLNESICFETTVTSVERDAADGFWAVTSEPGGTERFHAVVVANGHNWSPKWPSPTYPGDFAGEQMHAHDYANADAFRDKRVLIVGMGNSAMDIAVDASFVSRGPVLLSARRGVYIVPKYLFGKPADATGGAIAFLPWRLRQSLAQRMLRAGVGRPERYGLPPPAIGLFQNHPTISDTIMHRLTHGEVVPRPGIQSLDGDAVVFSDGRRELVDVIVWATGYEVTIPFLSERWLGDNAERLPLYRRVFHLDEPTLGFVGLMQSTGAALPIVEQQSKLFAAFLGGTYALPSQAEQAKAVERSLAAATKRWGQSRPAMRVDFDRFVAELPREMKAGSKRLRRGNGTRFEGATA
jgi:hypothetical protein